jgi:tRNA(fMet)-specific endonuclease VapC
VNLAIDCNRYVDFCRGDEAVVDILQRATAIFVPVIVLAELRTGFLAGTHAKPNEEVLERFLRKDGVQVLNPDEQTTHYYAALYRQLRRQSTPIPSNDLWIAALVAQHHLTLYARDPHFDHLPQIPKV